jgi:peptidyl-tRNA hydrolase
LKIYVLVRRDLSASQRVVQACHAVVDLVCKHREDPSVRNWADRDKTLVVLSVRDERELIRWRQKLFDARIPIAAFVEPDMNLELTAIAVHPETDPNLFRSRQLL